MSILTSVIFFISLFLLKIYFVLSGGICFFASPVIFFCLVVMELLRSQQSPPPLTVSSGPYYSHPRPSWGVRKNPIFKITPLPRKKGKWIWESGGGQKKITPGACHVAASSAQVSPLSAEDATPCYGCAQLCECPHDTRSIRLADCYYYMLSLHIACLFVLSRLASYGGRIAQPLPSLYSHISRTMDVR